jgi:DNA polymerase-3 subunit delta
LRKLTPAAVRQQIASGSLQPVYLIDGDDEAAKSALAAAFAEAVEEDLRGFNVERFHAGDAAIADVLAAARTLPFGPGRRVVVVLHAERLPPKRDSEAAGRSRADLEDYLKSPQPSTTLVFVTGIPAFEGKFGELLMSRCAVVTLSVLDGAGDPRRWIQSRAAAAGVTIEAAAIRKLIDLAGGDPVRLREDTERVLLFAADSHQVDLEGVLGVVGAAESKGEWAVVNAIERGAAGVALKELALSLDEGAVPVMVLGQLAWYVRTKMVQTAPGRVPAAVDALFRTDVGLKSSGGDPRILLERLVLELCGR